MITTALIVFREFLEAFLFVGVFLGISRRLELKKDWEIITATALGVFLSVFLATGVFFFGDRARLIFSERNADLIESYLMIFSGVFLAYVVVSLHQTMKKLQGKHLIKAHNKLQNKTFDLSLFFTIVFLIFREGMEIALFTASASLFSTFIQNVTGLFLGFLASTIVGLTTFFTFIKLPIAKIFKVTEFLIVIMGAFLIQEGIVKLSGHIVYLRPFFNQNGIFNLSRIAIMAAYILAVYFLFKRKKITAAA